MPKQSIELWSESFYEAVAPAVNSIGFFKDDKGWVSSAFERIQNDFDIWYITEGRGAVKINNRWINLQPGDLVVMKPGESYQQEKADEDQSLHVYVLHVTLFGPGNAEAENRLKAACPRKFNLLYHPHLESLFAKLLTAYTLKESGYLLTVRSIALSIIAILFEHLRNRAAERCSVNYKMINRVRDFIEENYASDLSLEEMAKVSGFSFTYFSKLFREYFAVSPVNYHIDYRLKMARLFLAKSDSVTAASEKCGFRSVHYFSRLFKRRLGLSPSEFVRTCVIK
ncbi:MAG: AraC family transcriptional regulator [Victivallaceae bacterium]|nr:AraC family transcriptional regulator [Victivallaceae bacterium]